MNLFILEDEITKLLRKLERSAFDLKSKMDNKTSIEIVRGRLEVFYTNYEDLLSKIHPDIVKKTNLSRHVSFLKKYIESDQVENTYKDIEVPAGIYGVVLSSEATSYPIYSKLRKSGS